MDLRCKYAITSLLGIITDNFSILRFARFHLVLNRAIEHRKVSYHLLTFIKAVYKQFVMILFMLWWLKSRKNIVAGFKSPAKMGP